MARNINNLNARYTITTTLHGTPGINATLVATSTATLAPNSIEGYVVELPPGVITGSLIGSYIAFPSPSPPASPTNTAAGGTNVFGGADTTKAPTNTPSPTRTNSSSSSSPGLSPGAVAGVAIGCFAVGALLALAIALFCFKRRRTIQDDDRSPESTTIATDLKGYAVPLPPPPPADNSQLDKFLLDSTSDEEIAAELHALGTLIQSHVENNYHTGTVLVNKNTLSAALTQLGVQKGGSLRSSELASLALAPATRQAALQHVISQVVFTSIDTSTRDQLSMLPSPITAFLGSIPPRESGNNADVTSIALNKWRVLSAFLLHPARSQRTPLPASSSAISAQAEDLANALSRFLQYFVSGDEKARAQQSNHLKDVIVECTKLGYTVLSQPSEWKFVHSQGQGGGSHTAVVCAGLVKVTHRDGTPLASPNEVVAPTTVRV